MKVELNHSNSISNKLFKIGERYNGTIDKPNKYCILVLSGSVFLYFFYISLNKRYH